ncbi:hypothetical protein N7513_000176 [Penicillium frequentans]|nr:hypothetical protein N7513_000176 [Penicillium glabrum]
MKLSDYLKATSFLDAYISMPTTMAERKLAQPPYTALMYVMGQLTSYEDLRDLTLEVVQVHGTSADTGTVDDLRGIIETL